MAICSRFDSLRDGTSFVSRAGKQHRIMGCLEWAGNWRGTGSLYSGETRTIEGAVSKANQPP
ncbi:hypothetical protein C0V97_03295 [Asaia sp. W19]|nr:hypothetical protein C0V97_03295 [Asaia sp. W19]